MSERFTRLSGLVEFLRSEKGCPWDRDQTIDSLKPHLLEEMHETVEAIEDNDTARIREELGDVFFLILFTARIAEEEGKFSIEDVLGDCYEKMKSRHPHVFEKKEDMESGQVLDRWEQAKRKEKKEGESVLSGIPRGLPALIKARSVSSLISLAGGSPARRPERDGLLRVVVDLQHHHPLAVVVEDDVVIRRLHEPYAGHRDAVTPDGDRALRPVAAVQIPVPPDMENQVAIAVEHAD